jgi:ADP-ribose pyrophosphatase
MTPRPWKLVTQRDVADLRILTARQLEVQAPHTGHIYPRAVLQVPDWVNVVAFTSNDEALLVRQFRFGTWANTLEIPGGILEAGEVPQLAAARELEEETGFRAGQVTPLGTSHPNPALQNNTLFTFLATGCHQVHQGQPDEGEDVEVVRVPRAQLKRLVLDGTITHSLVLAALLFENWR